MTQCQPRLPTLWLMTDERIDDVLGAVAALPKGAGVVFRHHATPAKQRRALYEQVRRVARQRRLTLLLAGTPAQARSWRADGAHHRSELRSASLRSVSVHNAPELQIARRAGADLIFVSPVFATASHPGARALGIVRAGLLACTERHRSIALGGLTATKWRQVRPLGLHGWAAIDGLAQKRNAVPT